MKLTICIKSNHANHADHDKIRGTWGQQLRGIADVRFFMGRKPETEATRRHAWLYKSDETVLDVGETTVDNSFRVREICRWATSKRTDFIMIVGLDTVVLPRKIRNQEFQHSDYSGQFLVGDPGGLGPQEVNRDGVLESMPRAYAWADARLGYFLSQAACSYVSGAFPATPAEGVFDDIFVAQALGPQIALGMLSAQRLTVSVTE